VTKEQREAIEYAVGLCERRSNMDAAPSGRAYQAEQYVALLTMLMLEEPSHTEAIRRLKAVEGAIRPREGAPTHLWWADELAGVIRLLEEGKK
jgi:hypothetical protein